MMSSSSGLLKVALLPLPQRLRSLLNLRLIATVHQYSPLFKNNSALIWRLPMKFSSSTACSAHRRTDVSFAKVAAVIIALASIVHAQSPRPTFEVASIKPNTQGGTVMIGNQRGGRFVAMNVNVRMLFIMAFRPLQDYQILGGPSWLGTDRLDI